MKCARDKEEIKMRRISELYRFINIRVALFSYGLYHRVTYARSLYELSYLVHITIILLITP